MARVVVAFLGLLSFFATAAAAPPATSDGQSWRFDGLKPGEFVTQEQRIPVRIVLIGFKNG